MGGMLKIVSGKAFGLKEVIILYLGKTVFTSKKQYRVLKECSYNRTERLVNPTFSLL